MSPLFALEAEELLLSGEIAKAIELCEKGLEVYPDYPAALAILAKALEMSGNSEKSQEKIRKARNFFQSNKTASTTSTDSLVSNEIEDVSDASITTATSTDSEVGTMINTKVNTLKMSAFIDENFYGNSYISRVRESGFGSNGEMSRLMEQSTRDNAEKYLKEIVNVDEFLLIATKLENAKIPKQDVSKAEPKSTGKMNIYTDTIAEILEKQGAYSEALDAWQVLHKQNPDKSEFYESKIAAIKAKIY